MARRPLRIVRPSRREMVWFGAGFGAITVSVAATLLTSLNAAALALRPFTIIRTRLAIAWDSDQAAATEGGAGVFSMQVVSDSAVAAGVTAVPTPLTETDSDYFVYKPVNFGIVVLDATGFVQSPIGDKDQFEVDSKAMRKVGLDEDVSVVLQTRSAVGSVISVEGRFLVKLH